MSDKPFTAAEFREALRLLGAELVALEPGDDEATWRSIGALQALVQDAAGDNGAWAQRWALQKLRDRAARQATKAGQP